MTPTRSTADDDQPKALTVLESFPVPRLTTNPYLVLLAEALGNVPGVTMKNFSWRNALLGSYDVFHVHWPETLIGGPRSLKRTVRQLFTALILLRLRFQRIPVVRTMHNIERPDGLSRVEQRLLDGFDRRTTLRIRLNELTKVPDDQASATILHGHYRDWFEPQPKKGPVRGQIGYTGLIRRYKGVETLLTAFSRISSSADALTLRVAGKPSTDELAETMRELAVADQRISLKLDFLSDAELVEVVTSSEMIVLPYRFMHNSGGILAALSLDRPVLVPAYDVNDSLAREVGPGWIYRYDGELSTDILLNTLQAVRRDRRTSQPNLSARGWEHAGFEHARAFRHAVRIAQDGS